MPDAKVELSTDKRLWHPQPMVDQIVLVTTVYESGVENVSTKSRKSPPRKGWKTSA